jgi:hypothetical protein
LIRFRSKKVLAVTAVIVVLLVFSLPAFVAYRYTAPEQRSEFITHPWRGWNFVYAALAVPGGAKLKTSGMALRKADWMFKGTAVDPREVQLLFVAKDKAYTFTHAIGDRSVTSTVLPSYRFMWQVEGVVDTIPGAAHIVVALLDYNTGRVLYDVRDSLRPSELAPEPPSPSPSEPAANPSPSATP